MVTCSGCRTLLARQSTRSFASVSSPRLRQTTNASSSSSSIRSSNRTGNGSNSRFQPSTSPRNQRQPWLNSNQQRRVDPRAPADLTTGQILQKLQSHLKSAWLEYDASVAAFGIDIGVYEADFKPLAAKFAIEMNSHLQDQSKAKDWDLEGIRSTYREDGADAIDRATIAKFIQWSSLPSSTARTSTKSGIISKLGHLARLSDNRNPGEFFPFARRLRRTLILHVGPTNSGKTYSALIALARARTGVYAGPLRLLAHEVFSRFNEGKIGTEPKRMCNLITGEEQRVVDVNQTLSSCTVEMFPLNRRFDVGVIDEIQMIGDLHRGSAWTNAVIGSQCDELHLCGEESVVPLIQKIAAELGDECIVKRYQRLSPLAVSSESLNGQLSKIRRGDCLVTFSRNNIFALKRLVEEKTGLKVAVAYGGLPPEVREEQARSFNAGDYDVLVASDAVGMGLNLKIKRIVFESVHKFDGRSEIALPMPQMKQIAGRAGRFGFNAADPNDPSSGTIAGEVTTLDAVDMDLLNQAMASSTTYLSRAAISPPFDRTTELAALLPIETPHSTLISLLSALSTTSPHFFAVPFAGARSIADAIQHVKPLSLSERVLFTNCPANMRDDTVAKTLVGWCEAFAEGRAIDMAGYGKESGLVALLQSVSSMRAVKRREDAAKAKAKATDTTTRTAAPPSPATLSADLSLYTPARLAQLESFHRCLSLYLWLSYRVSSIFCDAGNAVAARKSVEGAIEFTLAGMAFERVSSSDRVLAAQDSRKRRSVMGLVGKTTLVGVGSGMETREVAAV